MVRACPEDAVENLAKLLLSLRNAEIPDSLDMAFSGGLDSSVMAYLLKESVSSLITVGVEGSRDMENAREVADILQLPLREVVISEEDIMAAISFLASSFPELSAVEISFEMPLQRQSHHGAAAMQPIQMSL